MILPGKDYFDRIRVRNECEKVIRYMERNPVKAGLCKFPEVWGECPVIACTLD